MRRSLALAVAALGLVLTACPSKDGKGSQTPADVKADEQFLLGDLRVCSVDRWCWENPMPQGNDLLAIWARAAGSSGRGAKSRGTQGRQNVQLCAVGRDGAALHYSGHAWRREPTRVHRDLFAVWGPALDATQQEEFLAVGAGGTLLHFRDARWQWRDSGTRQDLRAITGLSAKAFYVAGAGGTLLGCSSGGCTAIATPTRASLDALALDAEGGLWAAGDGVVLHRPKASAKRPMKVIGGAIGGAHRALYPRDGGGVYLASEGGRLAICEASKGCRALKISGADPKADLLALAPGGDGRPGALPLALTVEAKRSRIVQLVDQGGELRWELLQQLTPLRLAALAASPGRLVAVGERAALVRFADGIWQQEMPTGPTVQLSALWGRSASELWAVGDKGTVLHLDGRSWQRISSSTAVDLHAVAADGSRRALIAGDEGTLLSCDAKRCERVQLATRAALYGLASRGGLTVAVGARGLVLRREGQRWRQLASGGSHLYAVTITGDGAIWVAGDGGRLARLANGKLEAVTSGTTGALFALADDRRGGVLAGGDGVLLRCRKARCEDITPRLPRLAPGRAAGAGVSTKPTRPTKPTIEQRPSAPAPRPKTLDKLEQRSSSASSATTAATPGKGRRPRIYGLFVERAGKTLFAVGPARRVLVFDGARWRRQFTGFAGQLRALWGSAKGHLFAAGEGGAILQHVPKSANTPPSN